MELDDFQHKVFDFVKSRPSPGCHCSANAFMHLKKAWKIRKIDPEMAYFRCGCAEEEAATAIFQSLKRLKYANAKKLNFRNHVHKLAVEPFIWVINKAATVFHEAGCKPEVTITEEQGKKVIYWSFIHPETRQRFRPVPPFNFVSKVNGSIYDFSLHTDLLKDIGNVKEVIDYLRNGANNRNLFLYASSQGIRKIDEIFVEKFIKEQYRNVTILLIIYLLIDTCNEQQSFVQQCLNAFIKMLGQLPKEIELEPSQ